MWWTRCWLTKVFTLQAVPLFTQAWGCLIPNTIKTVESHLLLSAGAAALSRSCHLLQQSVRKDQREKGGRLGRKQREIFGVNQRTPPPWLTRVTQFAARFSAARFSHKHIQLRHQTSKQACRRTRTGFSRLTRLGWIHRLVKQTRFDKRIIARCIRAPRFALKYNEHQCPLEKKRICFSGFCFNLDPSLTAAHENFSTEVEIYQDIFEILAWSDALALWMTWC